MFFTPPRVKSISRYAEFGTHLGLKHLGVMLLIAMLIHAGAIGVYSLFPHQQIIRIPVRVLNMKLGSEISEAAFTGGTQPAQKTEVKSDAPPASADAGDKHEKSAQSAVDKALSASASHQEKKHAVHAIAQKPANHPVKKEKAVPAEDEDATPPPESSMDVPKQYVHNDGAYSPGAETGNNNGGTEIEVQKITQSYEQAISLWVKEHQIYPAEAKARRIEGDVTVRVRVNRAGHFLYFVIDKSSGNALLDNAAISMVRASDPAPPLPKNYPQGKEFAFKIALAFRVDQ